jgi:acetyl esterase/lipase
MKHIGLFVVFLTLISTISSSYGMNVQNGVSKKKPMSVEELQKEPITFELDIPYANDGNPMHRLDIYLPKKRKSEKLPVIVFIHGGAWLGGDKSDESIGLIPFVRNGKYAVISINYRLTGEAKWPAQIYDCKAAIRWVRANSENYGFDSNHIGVWGKSAGAHLALMLGVTKDAKLEGDVGQYKGYSSKVEAVVNFFGPTDLNAIIGQPSDINHSTPFAAEALLIGGAVPENPDKARAASPVTYVTAQDSPVFSVHGNADKIVPYDQALRIDAALHQAQVPTYLITIKNGGHGDFGNIADKKVEAFFDKYLRGEKVKLQNKEIILKDKSN